MLFELCKCPKCSKLQYSPDFEDTVKSYIDNEYNNLLVYTESEPPKAPTYLIFKCMSCNFSERIENEVALKMIVDSWSNLAWNESQREARRSLNFEQHFTKYILDKTLNKFITQRDIDSNPLIRDYIKTVENEEAKHNKKSND